MDQNPPLTDWKLLQPRSPHEPLAEVLEKARNITDPGFFRFDYETGIHNPYLFKDMEKAVQRIIQAINNKEGVIIAGDYDLDGISGTAVLLDFFRHIGYPVHFKLPHRVKDGYGLSAKTVVEAKKEKIKVIITVDNGISCFQEITLAQSLGIDVIITDHHTIPDNIPPAFAILHPKVEHETYPDRELTGSGVAYKLACALAIKLLSEQEAIAFCKWALDLATLGTIADMGPLTGENRQIVHYGLQVLAKQRRPGIKGLLALAGHNDTLCSAETVGFKLGPRLNAAGRMAEASLSLQLLLATDSFTAQKLAIDLEALNTERKKVAEEAFLLADKLVQSQDTAAHSFILVSLDSPPVK
jgi:single-stranded-DNA-specific exonuclease